MFPPQEVETVLSLFAEMKEPPADWEWETTRARVQAAILISAQSKLERILKGLANSQIDWRDTLMGWALVSQIGLALQRGLALTSSNPALKFSPFGRRDAHQFWQGMQLEFV